MNEVGVEIVKTEEVDKKNIKYLNINVSNSEVERKPDIVRLCADAGILEYVKPKTGHWIDLDGTSAVCSCCYKNNLLYGDFCKWCGTKMVEPQGSEETDG